MSRNRHLAGIVSPVQQHWKCTQVEVVVITNKNGRGDVYDDANHLQDVDRDQLS